MSKIDGPQEINAGGEAQEVRESGSVTDPRRKFFLCGDQDVHEIGGRGEPSVKLPAIFGDVKSADDDVLQGQRRLVHSFVENGNVYVGCGHAVRGGRKDCSVVGVVAERVGDEMQLRGVAMALIAAVDDVFKLETVGAEAELIASTFVAGIVRGDEARRIDRWSGGDVNGKLLQSGIAKGDDHGIAGIDALDEDDAVRERDFRYMKIERDGGSCGGRGHEHLLARLHCDLGRERASREQHDSECALIYTHLI